jgi:hypothetical protein
MKIIIKKMCGDFCTKRNSNFEIVGHYECNKNSAIIVNKFVMMVI